MIQDSHYSYNSRFLIRIIQTIEFPGRNPAVLKAAPKRNQNAEDAKEEEKHNGEAGPKKVITIKVSLKEWLIKKRADQAFIPFVQPPISQLRGQPVDLPNENSQPKESIVVNHVFVPQ